MHTLHVAALPVVRLVVQKSNHQTNRLLLVAQLVTLEINLHYLCIPIHFFGNAVKSRAIHRFSIEKRGM